MNTILNLPRYKQLRRYMQFKRTSLICADITINVVIYGALALFVVWMMCKPFMH